MQQHMPLGSFTFLSLRSGGKTDINGSESLELSRDGSNGMAFGEIYHTQNNRIFGSNK